MAAKKPYKDQNSIEEYNDFSDNSSNFCLVSVIGARERRLRDVKTTLETFDKSLF